MRSRRRLTTTTMTWDGTAFFVLIKLRLDGHVCNTILIFIVPPSSPLFSPSVSVAVNVCGLSKTLISSPRRLFPFLGLDALILVTARAVAKDGTMAAAGAASVKGAAIGAANTKLYPPPPRHRSTRSSLWEKPERR